MDFNDWTTQYNYLRSKNYSIGHDPLRFYGQLRVDILNTIYQKRKLDPKYDARVECVAYNQAGVEGQWYRCRTPYFKIYPGMLKLLTNTDINIPARYVHTPLRTILYRLPKNHKTAELCDDTGSELRSILIDELAAGEGNGRVSEVLNDDIQLVKQRRFVLWFDWGENYVTKDGDNLPVIAFQIISIADEEQSFEEALKVWLGKDRLDWDKGHHISNECLLAAARLAVGICLLATNAHKLIEHDVLNKHVERYRKSNEAERNNFFERAKQRGKHGWLLGRELSIPSIAVTNKGETGTRGELTRAHLRRGHFHLVLYGVKKSLTRVDWFPPTVVRPDLLPSKSVRGYKSGE